MGHHIDSNGRFQSDKYPNLPSDKVAISLKDPAALPGLRLIAWAYLDIDREFATDLGQRLVDLSDDLVEVTLVYTADEGDGVGVGWWWWESDVPEEGAAGPYQNRDDALVDMPDEAVVTSYSAPEKQEEGKG